MDHVGIDVHKAVPGGIGSRGHRRRPALRADVRDEEAPREDGRAGCLLPMGISPDPAHPAPWCSVGAQVGHMAVSRSYGNWLPWSRKNRWVRGFYRDAEQEVGQRGERAVERLCGRIGPTVVLYELLDPPGAGPQGTGTLFVVDVGEDLRGAARS